MWNWNIGKTFIFGLVTALTLFAAGISLRGIIVISLSFTVFVHWLIREINFIRESHGSNLEEIENELEDAKRKNNE